MRPQEALDRAVALLTLHRDALDRRAARLVEHQTLSRGKLDALAPSPRRPAAAASAPAVGPLPTTVPSIP